MKKLLGKQGAALKMKDRAMQMAKFETDLLTVKEGFDQQSIAKIEGVHALNKQQRNKIQALQEEL